jgi:hypothetical protein
MASVRSIVFVCLHGLAKSMIAATYLNHLSMERGLTIHATAAGIEPEPDMLPQVCAGLLHEGLDVRHYRPRRITPQELTAEEDTMRGDAVRRIGRSAAVVTAVLVGLCWQLFGVAGQVPPGKTSEWTFDKEPVGGLPGGTTVFSGKWAVRAEAGAPSPPNALCQTGVAEFPALSLGETVYTDATIEASFKPISGREDQAAGIIFRIQDKDNYYIVRANALENNLSIYKFVRGKRMFIKGANAKVSPNTWQQLGAEVTGSRIRGSLNNQPMVEATDDTFRAGKIGLWTKADSVTCFDNVRVTTR